MQHTLPVAAGPVSLRAATFSDHDWLFALQCRPETRQFSGNPQAPTSSGHTAWLATSLNNPERLLGIIEWHHTPVGMVRLDQLSPTLAEVSIAILPEHQHQGIGRLALNLLRQLAPNTTLRATVQCANTASQALFLRAGYVPHTVVLQSKPQTPH